MPALYWVQPPRLPTCTTRACGHSASTSLPARSSISTTSAAASRRAALSVKVQRRPASADERLCRTYPAGGVCSCAAACTSRASQSIHRQRALPRDDGHDIGDRGRDIASFGQIVCRHTRPFVHKRFTIAEYLHRNSALGCNTGSPSQPPKHHASRPDQRQDARPCARYSRRASARRHGSAGRSPVAAALRRCGAWTARQCASGWPATRRALGCRTSLGKCKTARCERMLGFKPVAFRGNREAQRLKQLEGRRAGGI